MYYLITQYISKIVSYLEEKVERVPEFLIKSLENQYGKELLSKIIDGYKTKRKVS